MTHPANPHPDSESVPSEDGAVSTPDAVADNTGSVPGDDGSLMADSAATTPLADADGEVENEDDEDNSGSEDPASRGGGRRRALEREGEVAADFLETLLDIADLDGDIDLDIDGDRAAVAVVDSDEGRVPRRLVGPEGKVLEALQELTRLAVQSVTGERSRLMLDVAGFRAERRAALVTIAKAAIEECKASGGDVNLEPMTAFERKVVHDEVLAAGLSSQSSGVEPRRYVVVSPG
ncbi:MAG: R3H domain-containing nucleic acid-binding protein [Tetrasphaera sp.]